jgi:hypothetical protein
MVRTEMQSETMIDEPKRMIQPSEIHENEVVVMGGWLAEAIAGAGAIVLSILGLAGIFPSILLPASIIALGSAFVLQSSSIGSRFNWVLRETTNSAFETGEVGVGMTTEFVGGVAGIALGVLSLLGLVPDVLMPIGVLVFGLTLLLGVGVQTRLNHMEADCDETHHMIRRIAREAVSAASGIQILFGLGAVTLGILSLIQVFVPAVLTLIAILAVGGATFFSGVTVSARMWGFARFCGLTGQGVHA